MPVGKYYCDYCDKEFQDTPHARKRHLEGVQHHRAKTLWYNSVKDSNYTATDGLIKGVCNRFVKTGFCPYGDACKYLHPKSLLQNTTQLGNVVTDREGMSWGNLPPSLKPPPEGGYPHLPFLGWG